MNQFKVTLQLENEILDFSFNQIYTAAGEKFFITVNKDGSDFVFDIQKDGYGRWKIGEPAPKWVRAIERELIEAINPNN